MATKLKIEKLARSKGMKTPLDLRDALDTERAIAHRLWKGDMKMIGLTTINALCHALDCEPGDLFEFRRDKKTPSK